MGIVPTSVQLNVTVTVMDQKLLTFLSTCVKDLGNSLINKHPKTYSNFSFQLV